MYIKLWLCWHYEIPLTPGRPTSLRAEEWTKHMTSFGKEDGSRSPKRENQSRELKALKPKKWGRREGDLLGGQPIITIYNY